MSVKSPNPEINQYKVTWNKYDYDIRVLAGLIAFKHINQKLLIYPVMRGGMAIALHLSHLLPNSEIALDMNEKTGKFTQYLIVDDVSDTGNTLLKVTKLFKKKRKKFIVATLYRKSFTKYEPDFYFQTINKWIVYPWEV